MKKIIALILILTLSVVGFASCKGKTDNEQTTASGSDGGSVLPNPTATITMKDGGVMKVELFYDKAPNTVKNFISLANSGFYDELTFHRVIPGFMIQGGDPDGVGIGGPGYAIRGEFSENGIENDVKHIRGCISMARSQENDSAGSQFFICVADVPHLDGKYAAFGMCREGMEVADNIVSQERDGNDKPLNDIVIKSVRVEVGNADYGEPETLPAR